VFLSQHEAVLMLDRNHTSDSQAAKPTSEGTQISAGASRP
jgi:hypothetical protein